MIHTEVFYLLGIVECRSISLILEFGRFDIVLESAEVVLAKLSLCISLETLIERRLLALVILSVDGRASRLCERLAEQVLRFDLGYVASIAWDVLCLQVLSRATKPVLAFLRVVTVCNGSASFIHNWRL